MARILIVEDEEKVRRLYVGLLENEGYKVVGVSDAMQANEILQKEYFDIMLLDIKLPQVYGSILFDLMQVFHKKIKVIVASVYPLEEQKKIIRDAADYFDKAQGVDVLLEKIKKVARGIIPQNKILVIDDEIKIRKLFRGQLEEIGYHTLEAEDGEAGLELLAKEPDIGLVILDIALPKKIGAQVCESIKGKAPSVKIIVSSVFPKHDQQALIKGADDYFDKAEDIGVLVGKVGQLLAVPREV